MGNPLGKLIANLNGSPPPGKAGALAKSRLVPPTKAGTMRGYVESPYISPS
jgi:hypothetical protein